MGAATALLHGDRDPSIAAMVSHLVHIFYINI
jgi:hypothetical protein